MRRTRPSFVAAVVATTGLAACSATEPTIAVGLNPGGCEAPVINVPTGNGASLGRADAVSFSAGPRGERDGIFGRLSANK